MTPVQFDPLQRAESYSGGGIMKRHLWVGIGAVAAVVIIVAVILLGTGSKTETVKIGVILCLSGPGAAYGKQVQEGIELCLEEINSEGGIGGKKIDLVVEDDQTEPKVGVSAANKLIDVDKIRVIIGALASNVTLAVAPIAERNQVILMSPGSSNDKISDAGDFIFRIAPTDSYDGFFLAGVAKKLLDVSRVAVLYLNNEFGAGLNRSFTEEFQKLGGTVCFSEGFLQGATDFRTQLNKMRSVTPQALFLIANTSENIVLLRQMKELGIDIKVFAPSTFNDPQVLRIAGEAAEGVIFSAAGFEAISDQEQVKTFLRKFEDKYNRTPTSFAAYGYDALRVLAAVIGKAGYDPVKIKAELYRAENFPGASGRISFDSKGDAQKELSLYVVRSGKFEPFRGRK
jgi:branched-chain amino acid transport system substrate-binding protein